MNEIDERKKFGTRKGSPPRNRSPNHYDKFQKTQQKEKDQTTHLSSYELESLKDENYDDASLYFGEEAKDSFWSLYKSERRFKDFDALTDEI